LNGEARFLPDLAPDTFLRRFSRLEFPTQPIPLAFMDIVKLLVAVNHQGLSMAFDVA
jgi:hypothetical protein